MSINLYTYRKQRKLSGRKLLRFSRIINESRKFSLLIDRCHAIDIIMEAKSQKFSQHFHKPSKLFSCLTFVIYSSCVATLDQWSTLS